MIQRIIGPLPVWMRRDHPMLRYELLRQQPNPTVTARIVRVSIAALLLGVLLAGSYVWATDFLQESAGFNIVEAVWRTLFFPVLIIQLVTRIAGLSIAVGAISDERRRQTWDNVRATEHGAEMTLRTRWVAVFYRLRGLILLLIGVRVVLVAGLLYHLTSHRGAYLDILTANITPQVPVALAVILLAMTLTAAFLLPFTGLGVDIALGLLISTAIRSRAVAGILQFFVAALRVMVFGGLLYGATLYLQGQIALPEPAAWLLMGGFSAFGDWGITLLNLRVAGDLWAIVPYGLLFGAAMLGVALVQTLFIEGLLGLAVRRAHVTE